MDRELQWPASESNRELSEKGKTGGREWRTASPATAVSMTPPHCCSSAMVNPFFVFNLRTCPSSSLGKHVAWSWTAVPQVLHLTFLTFFSPSTLAERLSRSS